jgi:hypothetical protein
LLPRRSHKQRALLLLLPRRKVFLEKKMKNNYPKSHRIIAFLLLFFRTKVHLKIMKNPKKSHKCGAILL